MIDMNEAVTYVYAVVSTCAAEESSTGVPSGLLYAALMERVSLDDFQKVVSMCVHGGFVSRGAMHCLVITDKGRTLAAGIEAELAKAKAKKVG